MIKTATDDLDAKKITPRQLLTRVQFKCNLSAFTGFNAVGTNPDDTLVGDLKLNCGTDNEEEEGAVGGGGEEQQEDQQQNCCVCYQNPVTILLLACGHYCLCKHCFNVMVAGAIQSKAISTVHVPISNDVQYLAVCFKCRTKNSSITDVVNRKIFF